MKIEHLENIVKLYCLDKTEKYWTDKKSNRSRCLEHQNFTWRSWTPKITNFLLLVIFKFKKWHNFYYYSKFHASFHFHWIDNSSEPAYLLSVQLLRALLTKNNCYGITKVKLTYSDFPLTDSNFFKFCVNLARLLWNSPTHMQSNNGQVKHFSFYISFS